MASSEDVSAFDPENKRVKGIYIHSKQGTVQQTNGLKASVHILLTTEYTSTGELCISRNWKSYQRSTQRIRRLKA